MTGSPAASDLKQALAASRSGDIRLAARHVSGFLAAQFPELQAGEVTIRQDSISLNSVNGFFTNKASGQKLFFKFHMEESEQTVEEYYRAEILSKAGYPVDMPLYVSKEVGKQFLIYPFKESERLFDVCQRLDACATDGSAEFKAVVKAQAELDRICAGKILGTLTDGTTEELEKESLLQLFYWRLVDRQDDGGVKPGGRHGSFYVGKTFAFPGGVTLSYDQLKGMTWVVNGLRYPLTLEQGFDKARRMMAPGYYPRYPACIGHGDAHNGNVWANKKADGGVTLSWFDPAFAGAHIPVLLEQVKPLFHNIFAHPDWLYDSKKADAKINVSCRVEGNTLHVDHDWILTPLRAASLDSKRDNFWIPVVKELKARGKLPPDWEDYVRAALFCCPTLVMNLRAGEGTAQNTHTPKTSALGLALSMMMACAPENGADPLSAFFGDVRGQAL